MGNVECRLVLCRALTLLGDLFDSQMVAWDLNQRTALNTLCARLPERAETALFRGQEVTADMLCTNLALRKESG